jgi:uncharacterized protein (TIGR03437 family)
MKITLFVCLLFANGLWADTVETAPFLANLGNSVVGGSALLLVHEVLDGSGNLKSGSIEVSINSQLPIRDVEIRGNIAAIDLSSGQVQFGTGAGQPSLGTIQDMLANPANYNVSINAGAVRGQVLAAQTTVLMGLLSAESAVGIVVLRAFDASGSLVAALISADYNGGTPLTGLDIGGLAVPGVAFITPSDPNFAAEVTTVNGLCAYPNSYSISLRTAAGEIGSPLRSTGMARFQLNLNVSAPSAITVYSTRNADGTVAAAYVFFDVNTRFAGPATFTGLDINSGTAGAAGPVVIATNVDSDPIASGTGNVSIFGPQIVSDTAGVQAVNALLQNPAAFYLNLRSTGGSARAQLSDPLDAPNIDGVAGASSGSIVSVYGHNLSAVTSDLSGMYQLAELPRNLDGVSVRIGGISSPISYVSPGQINAQVPYEAQIGSSELSVTTASGTKTTSIVIARVGPSIFIVDPVTVKAGDAVVIYSTGLGQTNPPVATGTLVVPPGGAFNNTSPVTVTIGGQDAAVIYSIAAPGFVGLYQTAVLVPAGVSGSTSLVLTIDGVASNAGNITVQ